MKYFKNKNKIEIIYFKKKIKKAQLTFNKTIKEIYLVFRGILKKVSRTLIWKNYPIPLYIIIRTNKI